VIEPKERAATSRRGARWILSACCALVLAALACTPAQAMSYGKWTYTGQSSWSNSGSGYTPAYVWPVPPRSYASDVVWPVPPRSYASDVVWPVPPRSYTSDVVWPVPPRS
jgi:hypothetical protein